jgi:hypothetical protein
MRRRQFLGSASVLAGIAAVPFAHAVSATARDARFVLMRADDANAGAIFVPHSVAPCVDCSVPVLRVSIDGLHAAEGRAVLDGLSVHAMFDLPDGSSVPFVAWQYAAGPVPSRTDHARFIAGRATLRRLEIEYRLADSGSQQRETCHLTRFDAPLLAPGQYVLLGPRGDGSRVERRRLLHSGDVTAPLSTLAGRDFDYLAIRVEAVA